MNSGQGHIELIRFFVSLGQGLFGELLLCYTSNTLIDAFQNMTLFLLFDANEVS